MEKRPISLCKLLCCQGRRSQKSVYVIFVIGLIYLLFILNGEAINRHHVLNRTKCFQNFLSNPKCTYFNENIRRISTERIIEGSERQPGTSSGRTSTINIAVQGTNLTKLSSKTSSDLKNTHFTENTENNLTKITLKPNFSQMINASQQVSTISAPYLLENKNLCSSVKNLTTLIIVHTACDHFTRRQLARQTWANHTFYTTIGEFRILFLLGKPKSETIQKMIRDESEKYEDVLQGSFNDTYHNLTLKGVMAYKWLSERCKNAKFILKIDDDIVVDLFKVFVDILPKYATLKRQIVCNHIYKDTMPIIRKNNSKWFVHHRHFRGRNAYPTAYCSGFMILFTNDLMPLFFSSSKVTPFFWVDDVYLYGLVPGNVPGVKYSSFQGQWHMLDRQKALRCYRNATRNCDYLAIGGGGKAETEDIWSHIVKRYFLSILARKH
ncbi:beta-1,3-galactosyltransferase 1-like [Ruditapes philippinarum]|uniref:beta-1,3-galactosyltransferase 1-like n=1 Tax=Ruditapes philippinarum TaxID=129788 RepID=UPI00295BEE41|nr:beta-1,3-galactosyltransferase 1-like [Ruditapes philippinarum]